MNKSLSLVFFFLLVATFTRAQTSSGSLMFGGGIDFSSSSSQTSNGNASTRFSFSPSAGYFLSDNLVVGLSFTLTTEGVNTAPNRTTYTGFSMGPFARYYFFTSNEQFAIFGQAGLGFSSGRSVSSTGNVTRGTSTFFSVFPGAAYFFNEHWAIELSISGFRITSQDPDKSRDDDKLTNVNFGLHTFSPTLGFRYHL